MAPPVPCKPNSPPPTVSETWIPRGDHVRHLLDATVGERVRAPAGRYLYKQGELDRRFFVLLSGKVHVSSASADGRESTFNIMGPGSVMGEAAALTGLPRYSAALVIEAAELIQLQAGHLEDYVRADPRFASALICLLSVKQRFAVARLHQAVFEAPDQRILRLLEQMADSHVDRLQPSDRGDLQVHLTHEQIGNLTNLSRVTVTRTVQKLKRDGRVRLIGRAIVLSPRPQQQPH